MRPAVALVLLFAACDGDGPPDDDGTVTWHEDVAPILAENCQTCHRDGDIAPFSLTIYRDAAEIADLIELVTTTRQMPPYIVDASGSCNTYDEPRWLSDEDIATLAAWAAQGAPEGEPAEPPPIPEHEALPRVDAEFDIGVDFVPTGDPDEYRCFVVDPRFDGQKFLTAFEVIPGNAAVVHHAILYSVPSEQAEARATELDGRDEKVGYPCFGSSRLPDSMPLAAWAPGTPPTVFPEGTGIAVDGDRPMVLQLHYYTPQGQADAPDRTTLRLTLEDAVDRPALNLLVPYTDIVLPPGQEEVEESVTVNLGDVGLPIPVEVLGVFPHMHKIGTKLSFTVERADGAEACMTSVPDWDFDWQQFFFFAEPFTLGPSDTVTMSCTYDTSDRTETTLWGDGTDDEMCLLGMYVTAAR